MKTVIKKALTALALAVGFTTAATAATPVAVWDGDFTKTIQGYTLDLNGNAESEGVVTIDQTQGVKVNWTTAMTSGMTVLFKYSNLTLGSQQTIATSCITSDGTDDRTGVYLDANNLSHGVWNTTSTYDAKVATQGTMTDSQLSGNFALTYKGGSGTFLYRIADATCTCIYGNASLMSGNDGSIYGCTVGGTRGTTFAAATGLKISAIAIFNKVLTSAEMADYQFPSVAPLSKKYANTLSGDTYVPNGTYGAITVPGEGYRATALTAKSTLPTTGDGVSGNFDGIFCNGVNIQSHTVAGWFKVDELPTTGNMLLWSVRNNQGSYGGYTVVVDSEGKVILGRTSGNADADTPSIGNSVTTSSAIITAGEWCHLAIAFKNNAGNGGTGTGAAERNATVTLFKNGGAALTMGTLDPIGCNGNTTTGKFYLGANGLSVAGFYIDNNSILSGRTDLIVEAATTYVVPYAAIRDYFATLEEGMECYFENLNWNPALTKVLTAANTATITNSFQAGTALNAAQIVFSKDFALDTLAVVSEPGCITTFRKEDNPTLSVGTFDVSEAAGGIAWNATVSSYTACPALLSAIRAADIQFQFLGSEGSGATIDYGTAYDNTTLQGHLVFDGGTHTFQKVSESAELEFAENATVENPTIWVKDDTTLNFKARNPCGWSADASTNGIVRIGNGATVIAKDADANNGTWYWSQQFYLEAGSTLEVGTSGDTFRTVGDDPAAPHFVMPASEDGEAMIAGGADNYLAVPNNEKAAMNFKVGNGSTMTVSANLKTITAGKPFGKYGAGTLKLTGDLTAFNPSITVEEGTLTFAVDGTYKIQQPLTNNGKIIAENCTLVFMEGVTPGEVEVSGTGTIYYGYTVDINDCGEYALPAGREPSEVKLYNLGGEEVDVVYNANTGKFEFAWEITGKNCWWDYEFDGNVKSTGSDTTEMSREGTDPFYNAESNALWVGHATHFRGADYPEEFTAVIYGKIVNTENQMELGFGSTTTAGTGASTPNGVVIACGDPSQNEVKLLVTKNYAVVETISMKVPNAYDAKHLYAFTCQTVDGNTVVSVYLDGTLLQAKTFDGMVVLGKGFQIGSIHGGSLGGGYTKATTVNENAYLDFLRVYKVVMTPEAMAKYAEEYKYVSQNGESERTFAAGAAEWTVSEGTPWSVTPFDQPTVEAASALAGSVVKIAAEGEAAITMNLEEAVTYEKLTVEDGSALTVVAGAGAVAPTITGLTSIGADVTVAYTAVKFGNVNVDAGKTLTFDFAGFPLAPYYENTTIAYTGLVTGEGVVKAINLPIVAGRTATFAQNGSTGQYELQIALKGPLTATLGANTTTKFSDLVWKMGTDTVTPDWTVAKAARVVGETKAKIDLDIAFEYGVTFTADPTITLFKSTDETFAGTFQSATDEPIRVYVAEGVETTELPCTIVGTVGKNGPGTLTLAINRNFLVKEGTLKAASTVTATVTVDEGATFDFNGKHDGYVTLNLNGGTVLNNGGEMGTGKRQIEGVTVTSDSTIGGSGNFGLSSDGHHANTLALGTNTLVKTGANTFWFIKTTVTGTGTIDIQAGSIRVFEGDASFSDGTLTGSGTGKLTVDPNLTFTVGTLGNVTVEGAVKVTNRAYYSGIATNVTLAAGARVYFPAGVTHARKDFASKLTREGAISIDAAEGAEFAGTFVFPKAEGITFTEEFKAAIKAAGYAKRETSSEIVYFKPTVITIR